MKYVNLLSNIIVIDTLCLPLYIKLQFLHKKELKIQSNHSYDNFQSIWIEG